MNLLLTVAFSVLKEEHLQQLIRLKLPHLDRPGFDKIVGGRCLLAVVGDTRTMPCSRRVHREHGEVQRVLSPRR